MKYLLFDIAGTLLHKPVLYKKIQESMLEAGHKRDIDEIKHKHKLVSEEITFPDVTNQEFYHHFNTELFLALDVNPTRELLDATFKNCSYLPWEKFDDTNILSKINLPIGIVSNFSTALRLELKKHFDSLFKDTTISEEEGYKKPDLRIYEKAIERSGVKPQEIIYIGDSIKLDIIPATELGINSFLIDRDNYYPNHLNRIDSLNDLKNYI